MKHGEQITSEFEKIVPCSPMKVLFTLPFNLDNYVIKNFNFNKNKRQFYKKND